MQQKIPLNYNWLYKPDFVPEDIKCTPEAAGYETVDLPHTNKLLPLNYFSETEYQFVSCYKKLLGNPGGVAGKIHFSGI